MSIYNMYIWILRGRRLAWTGFALLISTRTLAKPKKSQAKFIGFHLENFNLNYTILYIYIYIYVYIYIYIYICITYMYYIYSKKSIIVHQIDSKETSKFHDGINPSDFGGNQQLFSALWDSALRDFRKAWESGGWNFGSCFSPKKCTTNPEITIFCS